MEKYKYYVVWEGLAPGIYDTWEECRLQVENVKGAKYKSFDSKEAAVRAFRGKPEDHLGILNRVAQAMHQVNTVAEASSRSPYIVDSIAVDAACSGNPGDMEYRGVYVPTRQEIFRIGPFPEGTNNIGEFLAIVHGLALLKKKNSSLPIYSDSANALLWVKNKKCKTKLQRNERNSPIFDLIERAEKWLETNTYTTPLLKWETRKWGEIPADFGRK
ncbi:ribonuclease H1 domain-containing protein [Coprobacter tertius]|uniref:Ribonuclease H n=1 Tax=Coprobacter tertius TaxID=2944915 RepID=A0ABT1MDB3_9BACT|nr:viroplasmin family protein [Coprobacter tertius]MCP9610623.1 viroplasmin family protein [Coprobacter tertius]